MIFIKPLKILFLKTRKTASTSVELALSELIENGDGSVITPLTPLEDRERYRSLGVFPTRTGASKSLELQYASALAGAPEAELKRLHRALRADSTLFNHVTLRKISDLIGSELDGTTVFTVERKAEQRLTSLLRYKDDLGQLGTARGLPVPSNIRPLLAATSHGLNNYEIYNPKNTVVGRVRVLNYDNLEQELSEVAPQLGSTGRPILKHAKRSQSPNAGTFPVASRVATLRCVREERALHAGWVHSKHASPQAAAQL